MSQAMRLSTVWPRLWVQSQVSSSCSRACQNGGDFYGWAGFQTFKEV